MEIEGDFQYFEREALPLDGTDRAMNKFQKQTKNPLGNGDSIMEPLEGKKASFEYTLMNSILSGRITYVNRIGKDRELVMDLENDDYMARLSSMMDYDK
ncbi:hypothetical protein Golax_015152, partial [Gossypium laxum]|nr:hypothetical protein [Gossypium laxum]